MSCREGSQYGTGGLQLAAGPLRNAQQQCRVGLTRDRLQDFAGLLCGQERIAIEQPHGVGERDFKGSGRLGCCAHHVIS